MDRVHDLRTRAPRHRVAQRLRHVTILGVLLLSALLHQAYAQPGGQDFEAGDSVVVLLGPLRVRDGAGLSFAAKGNQPQGAIGTILDPEPRSADGYRWWHVQWNDAMSGWSAEGTSEDAFIGGVQSAHVGTGEESTDQASDHGSSTDAQAAPPVGSASFDDFAGTWAGYVSAYHSDDAEPFSIRRSYAATFTLQADQGGSGVSGTFGRRGSDSQPISWHFTSLQGVVLVGGDEFGERILTLAPAPHLTPSLERYSRERTIHYERSFTSEGVTRRLSGVFYLQRSAEDVDWYEVDTLTVDHLRHLDEAAEVARAQLRHERFLEESRWVEDAATGCRLRAYKDHLDSDYYPGDVASVRWSGECRDGLAHGTGELDLLDEDGVLIVRWPYTGDNGLTFVDGIPTAKIDSARTSFILEECELDTLFRHLEGEMKVLVRSEVLDLANPLVTAAIRDSAIPFFTAFCGDQVQSGRFGHVQLRFWITNDDDPAAEQREWARRSRAGISAPTLDTLVATPDRIASHTLETASGRDDFFIERLRSAREAYSARREQFAADVRQAEEARFEASASGAVVRERANLESDYADLAIFVRDAEFGVAVTVPAQFPNPEFTAVGDFRCEEGRAVFRAEEDGGYSVVDSRDPVHFERFIYLTDAEVDDHGFYFRDVSATCDAEGRVTIETDDFHRTLALIDHLRQAAAFGFLVNRPRPSNDARYLALGLDAAGWLILNNPSWNTAGAYSIYLWESHRITASTNFATVGIKDGEGLQPVWFDGQASSPAFDPGRSLEVFSRLRADDPLWSYLTIDMRGGRLTWWRSTVGPR